MTSVIKDIPEYVLNACRGRRVLYVGAGNENGGLCETAKRVQEVSQSFVGLDADKAVVERNPDVHLLLVDLNYPVPTLHVGGVDMVVMTEVLEHLDAPATALRGVMKLAPGADFLGSVPNALSAGRVLMALLLSRKYAMEDGNHTMLFNRNTLTNTLRRAGLSDFKLIPYEERAVLRIVARIRQDFACGYVIRAKFPPVL